jgi:hypothetical protein
MLAPPVSPGAWGGARRNRDEFRCERITSGFELPHRRWQTLRLLPALDGRGQPPWLQSAASPGLGRIFRIAVFGCDGPPWRHHGPRHTFRPGSARGRPRRGRRRHSPSRGYGSERCAGTTGTLRSINAVRAKRGGAPPGRKLPDRRSPIALSRRHPAQASAPPRVRRSARSRRSHPDCHGLARAARRQASAA